MLLSTTKISNKIFFTITYLLFVVLFIPAFSYAQHTDLSDIRQLRDYCEKRDAERKTLAEAFKKKFAQDNLFLITPLIGSTNAEITLQNLEAPLAGRIKDTSAIQGIFGLWIGKNFDVSNSFWHTEVNNAKYFVDLPKITGSPFAPMIPVHENFNIYGNAFFVNAYLNKDTVVTPNIGFGYVYQKIAGGNYKKQGDIFDMDGKVRIVVKEPIAKLGLRINLKEQNLILNPYLSFAWTRTDVDIKAKAINIPMADMNIDTKTSNDSLVYGLSLKHRYRMFNSEFRYVYQDSLVGKKDTQSIHANISAMLNPNYGITFYFNYHDGIVCRETSFMVGPVLMW